MGSLMTFKEAAAVILREAQKPLHYDVITTRALQGNLIESQGLTPASTMGSILSQDIKENGSRS
ncbi:MAG: winged helix-turn-helix domain-containing protein, partial [Thaumarchaeota archaeon]|nr:winged helix-turn-helix domain-containing protein [Nitrososphaerota archaeon]